MRGVFDEEELGQVRQPHDTELTLGSGALLAIGCGLVLLCGAFFAIGYGVGHSSSVRPPAKIPQPATEQEPLQASGNIPKPSARVQGPVASPADTDNTAANASGAAAFGSPGADGGAAQTEVHSALPQSGSFSQSAANAPAPTVHPALPSLQAQPQGQQFMVQVASVSNIQDAEALVNALKNRNYPVISRREPADNLVHVRIGPFATRPVADQWRMKLLNDGYNAQVQP
jgi:cell division septation protein DedD